MTAIEAILFALSAAVPLAALVMGKTPERLASIIFVLAALFTILSGHFSGYQHIGILLLTIDGLMALSFLILAIRYNYLWVALLMGSMSALFAVHAFYFMTHRPLDRTFALASNLATVVLLASLAIGVWTSRHRKDEWH
ncbi:MAG: hypothetical protein INF02_03680 [Phenylobacterium sp.]|jgi:hypothetical protein|uniref:hypothetical protein n=1 Tax=Phenylobacterium sp. TaxID=1871053 RepID=UPI0025EE6B68|nr:hypothetical protein [Phenylobacterium sp.]MCA3708882.1 hypothetical protein [Phenylobacterium sp.]MCA6253624.1 hypothetical protein [Phenylobacterium sp.]